MIFIWKTKTNSNCYAVFITLGSPSPLMFNYCRNLFWDQNFCDIEVDSVVGLEYILHVTT